MTPATVSLIVGLASIVAPFGAILLHRLFPTSPTPPTPPAPAPGPVAPPNVVPAPADPLAGHPIMDVIAKALLAAFLQAQQQAAPPAAPKP